MKILKCKNNSPINQAILATIIVSIIITLLYFLKFDGNITGFFRIGSILPLSPYLSPENTLIYQGEVGYDGQQFLSLALDPFLNNSATIEALDHPVYRYRRILYPLLSYILGFGNRSLIPYIMVLINGISTILIVYISSLYLKKYNLHNQGIFVLFIPGVWIILSLSTADLLSSLFLISSIYFYQNNKGISSSILISLACLTRETILLIWIGLLITSIYEKKNLIKYLIFAFMPPLIWNLYTLSILGKQGNYGVKSNFGYPFLGIFDKIKLFFQNPLNSSILFEFYLFTLLLVAVVMILYLGNKSKKDNRLILNCTIVYSSLLIISSITILGYYLDYSRVFIDFYFLLLLTITQQHNFYKKSFFFASSLPSLAFLLIHS